MPAPTPSPEPNALPPEGSLPKLPQDLPHGILKPPQEVLDALACEKARFAPGMYGGAYEERTLNDWTVDYIFRQQLGFADDVLYRPTPEGPEVLAVGGVEILAFTKDMLAEEQAILKTWTPW
jgi:hypothetical protein